MFQAGFLDALDGMAKQSNNREYLKGYIRGKVARRRLQGNGE